MSKHTPINGLPPCAAAIMRFLSPHKTEAALQTRHRRLCLTGISTAAARSMLALLLILSGAGTACPLRAQQSQAECWMDDEGLWAWGFAEKFAIHDNRPWQYESVRKDGDRRTLTLRHDDERLSADFRQTSDSTCTIAVDGGAPQAYRLWDSRKGILTYLPADDTPPTPCDYRTDTAIVRGYIPSAKNSRFEVFHDDALDYVNPVETSAQTDSAGFFEIRLPLRGRTAVTLYSVPLRVRRTLWLRPGEEYFVCLQHGTPGLMGADSRLSLEMDQVPDRAFNADPRSIQYPHDPDDSTALCEIRAALARCEAARDSMTAAHPNLSAGFRQMAVENSGYTALRALGERMYNTPRKGDEHTLPGITRLTDSLLAALPGTPSFVSGDYDSFWNWYAFYLNYLANRKRGTAFDAGHLRQVIARQTDVRLPDSLALLFDRIESLESGTENASADGTTKALRDSLHARITEMLNRLPEYEKNVPDIWKIMTLQSYWNCFDALPLPAPRKEYATAQSAMKALRQSHTPLPGYVFDEAMGRIRTPGLRGILARQQEAYRPTAFDYQGSLHPGDLVAGLTDGEEILRRILAPHRGKVVYTDIWGTWCGPCKNDMKNYAPAIKEALKGRDVVFIYFANQSSDASWKQIIKEYGCVGPQTVHYNLPAAQQQAVERILLDKGYPSYGLFDKNGQFVTKEAPRPWDKDKLVRTIEELLRAPATPAAQISPQGMAGQK